MTRQDSKAYLRSEIVRYEGYYDRQVEHNRTAQENHRKMVDSLRTALTEAAKLLGVINNYRSGDYYGDDDDSMDLTKFAADLIENKKTTDDWKKANARIDRLTPKNAEATEESNDDWSEGEVNNND